MTEKLLTGTLSLNTNKQTFTGWTSQIVRIFLVRWRSRSNYFAHDGQRALIYPSVLIMRIMYILWYVYQYEGLSGVYWLVYFGKINYWLEKFEGKFYRLAVRLHSAFSVRIPNSINNFRTLIPAVRLRPLNLLSASSVNLHGLANISIFHNNLRVMLSPLKSLILRKYSNPLKRPGMYPSISKCNAKRCNGCMHLCTNSTVTSSVNGWKFSVVNNSDLD